MVRLCLGYLKKIGSEMVAAVAIPFLVLVLAALGGNIIQHRLVWSLSKWWSESFPGFRRRPALDRIFSKQAVANLAKGMVKMLCAGAGA